MLFTHWDYSHSDIQVWKLLFFFPPDIFETERENCQLEPQCVHCQNELNWSGRIGESQCHQCQGSTFTGRCQHQSLAARPRECYQCAGCPEGKCVALVHLLQDARAYQKHRKWRWKLFIFSLLQWNISREPRRECFIVAVTVTVIVFQTRKKKTWGNYPARSCHYEVFMPMLLHLMNMAVEQLSRDTDQHFVGQLSFPTSYLWSLGSAATASIDPPRQPSSFRD